MQAGPFETSICLTRSPNVSTVEMDLPKQSGAQELSSAQQIDCSDTKLIKPFRFLDLPGGMNRSGLLTINLLISLLDLRNYTYNLIAEATEHEPSVGISRYISLPSRLHKLNWGFMGLTQSCRALRNEFRPLYMAKLKVTIEPPDARAFFDSFLSHTFTEPRSSPGAVRICLDIRKNFYASRKTDRLDVTPFVQIMCSTSAASDVSFLCRGTAGGWLAPLLNSVKAHKSAWAKAFRRHHIHRLEINLLRGDCAVWLHMSPQVKGKCTHDSSNYLACGMGPSCPVSQFLLSLGISEDEAGLPYYYLKLLEQMS